MKTLPRELVTSSWKREGEGDLPSWRQGIRDAQRERQVKIGGEGGSCTEDVEF